MDISVLYSEMTGVICKPECGPLTQVSPPAIAVERLMKEASDLT